MTAATSEPRESRKLACTVTRTGRITWFCDVCGQPIKPKAGHITVDRGRAMRQYWEAEEREYQRRAKVEAEGTRFVLINVAEMMSWPDCVPWQALHHDCDPDLERDDYWFGVERVDTLAKLLNWAAHLMEKNWLPETRWDDLLHTVATAAGQAQ